MAEGLSLVEALLLGLIQGLTEWLPVSSSGHLVLAQQGLGLEATVFFDLMLHVGTLLVVLVFYRETIWRMLTSLARAPQAHRDGGSLPSVWVQDPDRRLALLVLLGSLPTAIIGFTFEEAFLRAFGSLLVVAIALILTGGWLLLSRLAPEEGQTERLTWQVALLVGAVQGLAIVPGISRSGATIGAALLAGVERELAVRFSFLLSVPAILGATILQADGAAIGSAMANLPAYAAGVVASIAVGYGALALLVLVVKRRGFHRFGWYCLALGSAVLYIAL